MLTAMYVLATTALALWALWRAAQTPRHGEVVLKLALFAIAAGAVFSGTAALLGADWPLASLALCGGVSTYCWWGAAKHVLSNRRFVERHR